MTTNLLAETVAAIESADQSEANVAWVGTRDGMRVVSWQQARPIFDIDYDSGFGGQEIAGDLVVVFADGSWLERGEYDGSEWWTYKRVPQRQPDALPFTRVNDDSSMWASVDELNPSEYGQRRN